MSELLKGKTGVREAVVDVFDLLAYLHFLRSSTPSRREGREQKDYVTRPTLRRSVACSWTLG
jgi:hypothetical protein